MKALLMLVLAAAAIMAGDVRLDRPLVAGASDAVMQYDDGTACLSIWGSYRGVWFNADDFFPSGCSELLVDHLEFWFYHHSSYPWDTASFYAELWNGDDASGPSAQLEQTSV